VQIYYSRPFDLTDISNRGAIMAPADGMFNVHLLDYHVENG
jgi:hypothetical protein